MGHILTYKMKIIYKRNEVYALCLSLTVGGCGGTTGGLGTSGSVTFQKL